MTIVIKKLVKYTVKPKPAGSSSLVRIAHISRVCVTAHDFAVQYSTEQISDHNSDVVFRGISGHSFRNNLTKPDCAVEIRVLLTEKSLLLIYRLVSQ